MAKYIIYIDSLSQDLTEHVGRGQWHNADTLQASGDNINELIEDATITTINQDGGNGPELRLTDLKPALMEFYIKLMLRELRQLKDPDHEHF